MMKMYAKTLNFNQSINITVHPDTLHAYELTTKNETYKIVFIRASIYVIVPVLYHNHFNRVLDHLTIDGQNVIDYHTNELQYNDAKDIKNLRYIGLETPNN